MLLFFKISLTFLQRTFFTLSASAHAHAHALPAPDTAILNNDNTANLAQSQLGQSCTSPSTGITVYHSCEDDHSPTRPRFLDCVHAVLNLPNTNTTFSFHKPPPIDNEVLPVGVSAGTCSVTYSLTNPGEEGEPERVRWTWDAMRGVARQFLVECKESSEGGVGGMTTGGYAFVGPGCRFQLVVTAAEEEVDGREMGEGEGEVWIDRGDGKGWVEVEDPVPVGLEAEVA